MAAIRVSGVQMSVSERLDANLTRILKHIQTTDADFILFPEMSLTGYHGDFSQKAAEAAWAQIAAACRLAYVTALIGTGAKTEEGTFIQTRIITDEGKLLGTHEKLVPTSGDRKFCRPGEELRVFKHRNVPFGCLICNDLWVTPGCGPYPDPRLAYRLGKQGARIIFHAIHSGGDADYIPYHESNLVLRARESHLYIVTANALPPNGAVNALSGVVSPEGKWLVSCPRDKEQHYCYDIELPEE